MAGPARMKRISNFQDFGHWAWAMVGIVRGLSGYFISIIYSTVKYITVLYSVLYTVLYMIIFILNCYVFLLSLEKMELVHGNVEL
jgi:hypothetical protein